MCPCTSRVRTDGFGTKHRACAALTKETNAIAVVVSESGGKVKYCHTIFQELGKYAIDKKCYDGYEQEIMDTYNPAYNRASRNTDKTKRIKDSKDFYDSITGLEAPSFINFNDTPKFFRNGLLHCMANDEEKNVVWKLKVDENE